MEPNDILTGIWMRRIEDAYQTSTDPLLVRVHRYDKPEDAFGWHLMMFYSGVEPFNPLRMTTLGLCTAEIDASIREAIGLKGLIDLVGLDRLRVYPVNGDDKLNITLETHITRSIAPTEWQPRMLAGDTELWNRIKVYSTPTAQMSGGRWAVPLAAH